MTRDKWFTWTHHGRGCDSGSDCLSSGFLFCYLLCASNQCPGDSSSLSIKVDILIAPAFKLEQFHLHSKRHKNRKYSQLYSDNVTGEKQVHDKKFQAVNSDPSLPESQVFWFYLSPVVWLWTVNLN